MKYQVLMTAGEFGGGKGTGQKAVDCLGLKHSGREIVWKADDRFELGRGERRWK